MLQNLPIQGGIVILSVDTLTVLATSGNISSYFVKMKWAKLRKAKPLSELSTE